jgi:hypothetical protein
MTSKEIRERLFAIDMEKAKLLKELPIVEKQEKEERQKEKFDKTKEAVLKLSKLYFNDEDDSDYIKQINAYKLDEYYRLKLDFGADVKLCLKMVKLNDSDVETIRKIVEDSKSDLDFAACIRNAEIKLDFLTALKSVRNGADISGAIDYNFDTEDLMNLMQLHKSNKCRKKIEDLLENCNYHGESGLLSEKKYDEFEKYIMED